MPMPAQQMSEQQYMWQQQEANQRNFGAPPNNMNMPMYGSPMMDPQMHYVSKHFRLNDEMISDFGRQYSNNDLFFLEIYRQIQCTIIRDLRITCSICSRVQFRFKAHHSQFITNKHNNRYISTTFLSLISQSRTNSSVFIKL